MSKSSVKKVATKKHVVKKKAIGKKPARKRVTEKKAAKTPVARKASVEKNKKSTSKNPARAGSTIVLKVVLAINDAKALHTELGEKLEAKKDISIDASAVEMADTAILQLLLAFVQKSQLQNLAVKWINPSQEFLNRSETLNLTGMLGLGEAKK